MSLLRFLGIRIESTTVRGEEASLARIASELERLDPARARFFAAFAYVLARVAGADLRFEAEEAEVMEETLVRCADIDASEARLVVSIAQAEVDAIGGTHNYIVTREFGRMSSGEERMQLLECLFAVAAADDVITGDETNEIIAIAQEIGLTREDALAVRSSFRDKLAEMRKLPGERSP